MKALVLTFGMLICMVTVKAQQTNLLNTNKAKPDTSYRSAFKGDLNWPNVTGNIPVSKLDKGVVVTMVISSMPITKLPNTDPGMPIVKTDKTGYTMPVAGMSLPPVYNMQKVDVVVVSRNAKP